MSLVLLLAGCEDREVARARNEQKLAPGCRIIDLDYGDLRVAVICEGRKTTTSLRVWTTTDFITMCDAQGVCTQQPVIHTHRHVTVEIAPDA